MGIMYVEDLSDELHDALGICMGREGDMCDLALHVDCVSRINLYRAFETCTESALGDALKS